MTVPINIPKNNDSHLVIVAKNAQNTQVSLPLNFADDS